MKSAEGRRGVRNHPCYWPIFYERVPIDLVVGLSAVVGVMMLRLNLT